MVCLFTSPRRYGRPHQMKSRLVCKLGFALISKICFGMICGREEELQPSQCQYVFCRRRSKSVDTHRESRTASSSATDLASSRRSSDVRASAISHLEDGHVDLQVGEEAPLPTVVDSNSSQTIFLQASNGEELTVREQVQLYCANNLLVHPLVSPALSYLGGLPELLVIASDAEVLRDEILYRFVNFMSCLFSRTRTDVDIVESAPQGGTSRSLQGQAGGEGSCIHP